MCNSQRGCVHQLYTIHIFYIGTYVSQIGWFHKSAIEVTAKSTLLRYDWIGISCVQNQIDIPVGNQ